MSTSIRANDWQCVGISQVGAAAVVGVGVYLFEFRSRNADFRGVYTFVAGGIGFGGVWAAVPRRVQAKSFIITNRIYGRISNLNNHFRQIIYTIPPEYIEV